MDRLTYLKDAIDTNWNTSTGGTKPKITTIYDIRKYDLRVGDLVTIQSINIDTRPLGINHNKYEEIEDFSIVMSTKTSRTRMLQIVDEVKRIIRYIDDPSVSNLNYALYSSGEDLTNKNIIFKYVITVSLSEVV